MKTISCRLSDAEWEALQKCLNSRVIGEITPSEFIRLMISREAKRRFGLELPHYAGALRTGRPKTNAIERKV